MAALERRPLQRDQALTVLVAAAPDGAWYWNVKIDGDQIGAGIVDTVERAVVSAMIAAINWLPET